MVKNVNALRKRASDAYRVAGRAYWAVRNGGVIADHMSTMVKAHSVLLSIIRQFREWKDLPSEADFLWYWGDVETIEDFVKMEVSDVRRQKREARILADRAAVDAMRPASAHIDRPIRSRRTYRLPPRPKIDVTIPPPVTDIMSQDAMIVALRALVERLPDETRLPDCSLNARHIRLSRRRTADDPAPRTRNERISASFGLFDYTPTRVDTVADLRALGHEELLALPRTGRVKVIEALTKLGRQNGIDVSFAEDPARLVPCSPRDRVVHALAHGLALIWDMHDSHTGRTHKCIRAYEIAAGELVETTRTSAYNETDGHVAGIATNTWPFKDMVVWQDVDGRHVAVLTDKGRIHAEKLLGTASLAMAA